jgi:hypothetical protein
MLFFVTLFLSSSEMQASAEIDSQTKQCRIRNGKEKYFIDFDY